MATAHRSDLTSTFYETEVANLMDDSSVYLESVSG